MQTEIIPFGKYKGQPIEVLAQDQKYLEWLLAQSWFKERYGSINTIIINNFQKPSETPEHNNIQASFTEKKFVYSFLEYCAIIELIKEEHILKGHIQLGFEHAGFDVVLNYGTGHLFIEIKPEISDDYPAILRQIKACMYAYDDHSKQKYQLNGKFVLISNSYSGRGATYDQVKRIFASSGICIILIPEIPML